MTTPRPEGRSFYDLHNACSSTCGALHEAKRMLSGLSFVGSTFMWEPVSHNAAKLKSQRAARRNHIEALPLLRVHAASYCPEYTGW